jgi:PPM family protein phosphatase
MPRLYAALSDIGRRRTRNEDAFLALPERGLFAVADGMGGHAAGDVASRLVIEALRRTVLADSPPDDTSDEASLRAAFAAARDALLDAVRSTPNHADMGTTLAVVLLDADGLGATLAHVGDSRIYRRRGNRLELLTTDHTWVQEQVAAGMLTPAEARHHPHAPLLTRVLDARGGGAPDVARIDLEPQDTLLLCTDGLTGPLTDAELAALLAEPLDPDRLVRRLIDAANARGGPDNITAVVVRVAGDDAFAPLSSRP